MGGPSERDAAALVVQNHFIRLVSTSGALRPLRPMAWQAIDEDVFGPVAETVRPFVRQLRVTGTSGKNSACVYEGLLPDGTGVSLYLSTLMPLAACVLSLPGVGLIRFVTSAEAETGSTVAIAERVMGAGFSLLSVEACRQSLPSSAQSGLGDATTVWEAFFEEDLDPPWEWPG